jgi:hypothetical protein
MNIKDFIAERLKRTTDALGEDWRRVAFVLFYEQGVERKSQSTQEDLANWWALPYTVHRRLSADEVVERIHFFDSIAPLWIKASCLEQGLIALELSQQLRKRKEILAHHGDAALAPFTLEVPYLQFGKDAERQGLLEYLTLLLTSTAELEQYFGENPPKRAEIVACIRRNFEMNYLFFPNNYSHREKGAPGYSAHLLHKNTQAGGYELLDPDGRVMLHSTNLDELIEAYLARELNYTIGRIAVER